jgi:hypothetical protein
MCYLFRLYELAHYSSIYQGNSTYEHLFLGVVSLKTVEQRITGPNDKTFWVSKAVDVIAEWFIRMWDYL